MTLEREMMAENFHQHRQRNQTILQKLTYERNSTKHFKDCLIMEGQCVNACWCCGNICDILPNHRGSTRKRYFNLLLLLLLVLCYGVRESGPEKEWANLDKQDWTQAVNSQVDVRKYRRKWIDPTHHRCILSYGCSLWRTDRRVPPSARTHLPSSFVKSKPSCSEGGLKISLQYFPMNLPWGKWKNFHLQKFGDYYYYHYYYYSNAGTSYSPTNPISEHCDFKRDC